MLFRSEYNKDNDLVNKIRGKASEFLFAYHWYSIIDNSKHQLLQPNPDIGWDWMIASTGDRIQVKRLTNSVHKQIHAPDVLDIRKKRRKKDEHGSLKDKHLRYTKEDFDYLAIHVIKHNIWCVLPFEQLLVDTEDGPQCKTGISMKGILRDRNYLTIEQLFSTVAENVVEKPVEKECIKKYSTSVLSFV